ncbi:MAG: replication protein [Lachnospiraceae bacterium]|nr:replication protein [Lachnospiraceae bacterium]
MPLDIQSRKWQLTINNPSEKGYGHEEVKRVLLSLKSLTYFCMSDEVASTYHTHVYALFSSPVRFSTLKNRFEKAHIEKAYGTSAQNKEYVFKEGKWVNDKKKETNLADTHEEYGEIPQERQGARNDCAELYELISEGRSNYEILEENPDFIKQVERIDRVRQIIQNEQFKEVFREMEVEYVFGKTGAGKTRTIMDTYGYSNVYRVTNYRNPFDQYNSQDVIAFEEFHGSLPISQMLLYLDGYPVMLPCRYSDKVACFTKVYILSNVNLRQQYKDIQENYPETWKAFLRRIHKVTVYTGNDVKTYNTEEYMEFMNIDSYDEIPFD